jgi:hypothetical protein
MTVKYGLLKTRGAKDHHFRLDTDRFVEGTVKIGEVPALLVREMPTQAPVVRRDLKSNTKAVVNQLRSAGILQVSDEAEAMVSKLMADNLPKATTVSPAEAPREVDAASRHGAMAVDRGPRRSQGRHLEDP